MKPRDKAVREYGHAALTRSARDARGDKPGAAVVPATRERRVGELKRLPRGIPLGSRERLAVT